MEKGALIPSLVGQEGDLGSTIINVVYLGSFLFFMVYGQKFQTWLMLREVGTAVSKLKVMRDRARGLTVSFAKESGDAGLDPTPRIDHFLEYFSIWPASLDPAGIVPKFAHLLDIRDQRFKAEVKTIAPNADKVNALNLEGVLEVAIGLNTIYRVIKHFYMLGKKTMNLYIIMQIQMQLPQIMEMAESYSTALKAFADGQPIGDGAGAIVAAKLMHGTPHRPISKEIVVAATQLDGRKLLVLKAEGPGSSVGKPGDAIKKLIEEEQGKVAMVIMIDAAGKFEGEESGGVSEGVGAAIGGIGVDQFTIEEISLKYKIPVNAVIVKESIKESVSPMTKKILEGTDVAVARVKRIIREGTEEGDTVIVAGIGNTVGVGQ
ncbi:hypothetical protein AC480_02970 [miscellaneous Crenarchaeota group archaeon SMTZ1-55]|nr:MAG: hypothetical protein AC480_02970 [miscellaneous Crenarchaeota group archaeon SMTZ1-55]